MYFCLGVALIRLHNLKKGCYCNKMGTLLNDCLLTLGFNCSLVQVSQRVNDGLLGPGLIATGSGKLFNHKRGSVAHSLLSLPSNHSDLADIQ